MSSILALHDSHNSSICEIDNGNIVYFQEAERLDKNKKSNNWEILLEKYTNKIFDKIIFVNTKKNNKFHEEFVKNKFLLKNIKYSKLVFEVNHHFFHACSAFFNSGFKNSFALIIDGNGSNFLFNNKSATEIVSLYYFNNNKFKEIFKVFESREEGANGKHVFLNTFPKN